MQLFWRDTFHVDLYFSIPNLSVELLFSSNSCVCACQFHDHAFLLITISRKHHHPQAPRATCPSHWTLELQRPPLSQIYMAEWSSKSDEYGRDDGGNTYPSLHAMLVCTNLSLFFGCLFFWCSGDLVEYWWIVGRHLFFGWGGRTWDTITFTC